jgi:hypothetical protein
MALSIVQTSPTLGVLRTTDRSPLVLVKYLSGTLKRSLGMCIRLVLNEGFRHL